MKLTQSYLTKNDCYTRNKKITVKGLMLHSVGVNQPSASIFVKNWNKSGLEKCVHAFIDANTGDVTQTLPWNHRGWHCGSSGNNTHIGVEMCEPAEIQYSGGAKFTIKGSTTAVKTANQKKAVAAATRTYESAVELFAMLCKEYKLDPMKDIISHAEGAAKKIASNHGDPEHLWTQLGLPYTMDKFRAAVKAKMSEATSADKPAASDASAPVAAPVKPEFPKKVRIMIADLRIRTGPGTNYMTTGRYTGVGTFTITEIQNGTGSKKGWGKLVSGAGWVSLDYVTIL